jgi:hypothetical protein
MVFLTIGRRVHGEFIQVPRRNLSALGTPAVMGVQGTVPRDPGVLGGATAVDFGHCATYGQAIRHQFAKGKP